MFLDDGLLEAFTKWDFGPGVVEHRTGNPVRDVKMPDVGTAAEEGSEVGGGGSEGPSMEGAPVSVGRASA